MSHMRSESVRGAVGEEGLEVVGRTVHDLAVVRREVYLVSWSGVRGFEGVGVMAEEGLMMGVTIGLVEPSIEAFSRVAVDVRGALLSRLPFSVFGMLWETSVAMVRRLPIGLLGSHYSVGRPKSFGYTSRFCEPCDLISDLLTFENSLAFRVRVHMML